jgi:hypothetical protein
MSHREVCIDKEQGITYFYSKGCSRSLSAEPKVSANRVLEQALKSGDGSGMVILELFWIVVGEDGVLTERCDFVL